MEDIEKIKTIYEKVMRRFTLSKSVDSGKLSYTDFLNKKHKDVTMDDVIYLESLINNIDDGIKFRYDNFIINNLAKYLSYGDRAICFKQPQTVLWLADGFIHKKKFYVDEILDIIGDTTSQEDYKKLFNIVQKQTKNNLSACSSLRILSERTYSDKFLLENIDVDILKYIVNKYTNHKNRHASQIAIYERTDIEEMLKVATELAILHVDDWTNLIRY
jgi:hypothetical protein